MSYDLTAKYRPSKLEDVVGHKAVVASLRKNLENRGQHAFLFTGESGIGKTTLARIVAGALDCDSHNILEIDAATYSSIDAMRKITEMLAYAPLGTCPNRTIIIDEAHGLSKQAWQSLLKSVEEPGPHTYWCFCSTDPAKIPQTIQTRCLAYVLKPLRADDLFDLAERIVAGERMDLSEGALGRVVKASDGSPRRLITLLAKVRDSEDDDLDALLDRLSSDDEGEAVDLARALAGGKGWAECARIAASIEDSAETVRHVVLAYMTKVALGAKQDRVAGRALEIIDAFCGGYDPTAGKAPLLVSIGRCVFV